MKTPPSRSSNMVRGQLPERNHKGKPTIKPKSSRFDILVARYYPAVYSFASRLTDDPLEAIMLTRDAFNRTGKQLESRLDEARRVTILLNACNSGGSYRWLKW